MSIDVLAYNALNADIKPLRAAVAAQETCIVNTNSSISAVQSCITSIQSACASAQATVAACAVNIVTYAGPNQAHLWCLIPEGSGWTGGVKVCNTAAQFNCGFCCAWTVPGGVTCARFQIWGAGAGSGVACCCGGSPIGGTGAYASVIIPVSAGNVYTLCAGCAFCCFASSGGNTANGCQSFVQGTNLTNFCADGGEGNIYCEAITRCIYGPAVCGYCMYLGACICNTGSDFCWNYASQGQKFNCCWDMSYPMIASCRTFFGSATGGTVFGVRGSFGMISMVCSGGMCVVHPPIYGFPSNSCCNCQVTVNYRQGCCRSAANGFMQIPGAGGWAGFKCGGQTNAPQGDMGRMGMVCVCFK